MIRHIRRIYVLSLFTLAGTLTTLSVGGRIHQEVPETTELEDFIIYENPKIMDALRKRPFTARDPLIEKFFNAFPDIAEEVYRENLQAMDIYLTRAKLDRDKKLNRLSQLAGLNSTPSGLIEGYDERLDMLELIYEWMVKNEPIQLKQLDIWKEHDLRYRLARMPLENIRLNPETDELESRLLINWHIISEKRPRLMDIDLSFDMGILLQSQTGYYDPHGFIQWDQINRKNLRVFELNYPIIITEDLKNDTAEVLAQYEAAFRSTMNSFYGIIREFFFSDLADMHTLYILTRGRIFSDEWDQHQTTAIQRGLAAWLVFKVMAEQIGDDRARSILQNDWTTWNLRKIGNEFNPIQWDGENGNQKEYLHYKNTPDMRNIYWSTLLVEHLAQTYGSNFTSGLFEAFRTQRNKGLSEAQLFEVLTGDELESAIEFFMRQH